MKETNGYPSKEMLSSAYINFLFGSGVNGKTLDLVGTKERK